MSLRHEPDAGCCDPEVVFELADGALTPDRRHEVREHIQVCDECAGLYERERGLNESLGAMKFEESEERSVCRGVAMALPTRHFRVRFLWSALAVAMLLGAVAAIGVDGVSPLTYWASMVGEFWGYISGISAFLSTMLAVAGSTLLVALAIGALIDLVIAAAIVSAARRT